MHSLDFRFEVKNVLLLVCSFLMLINFTSWHDEHYNVRIKIPKWMNKLFFNKVKNQTVPMISFIIGVQFYLSFVILSIVSFINELSLSFLLFKYLLIPFLAMQVIAFIVDAVVGYRRKYIAEKLSREAYLNKIHAQKKKARTKRKKRKL